MSDIRSVGEDFLEALQAELAEYNDGDGEAEAAKRACAQCVPWRVLDAPTRDIFQRAALRFLSE